MVWRTSRFATFMRPRPRFPWKFNRPFYISRHLINWPCVTIWWGYFSRVHERKFLWSIQVCACRGDWNFFPPESKERRVCAFDDSYKGYRRLSSILIRKTTLSKELCDPMILRQAVSKIVIFVLINRYIRKKKKRWIISQKKKTSNSINDLWPRNLNRAISARFRFRYHLERF